MAIEHLDVVELLVLLVNGHERFFVELPHFGADIGALGSGLFKLTKSMFIKGPYLKS